MKKDVWLVKVNHSNLVEDRVSEWIMDMHDPRMDGFVGFDRKKLLYRLQSIVNKGLKEAPHYVGEDEWLEENKYELAN